MKVCLSPQAYCVVRWTFSLLLLIRILPDERSNMLNMLIMFCHKLISLQTSSLKKLFYAILEIVPVVVFCFWLVDLHFEMKCLEFLEGSQNNLQNNLNPALIPVWTGVIMQLASRSLYRSLTMASGDLQARSEHWEFLWMFWETAEAFFVVWSAKQRLFKAICNMYMNHQENFLKFWFSCSRLRPEILHFQQSLGWYWWRCPVNICVVRT